jgi:pentatricopeptide repeat protein
MATTSEDMEKRKTLLPHPLLPEPTTTKGSAGNDGTHSTNDVASATSDTVAPATNNDDERLLLQAFLAFGEMVQRSRSPFQDVGPLDTPCFNALMGACCRIGATEKCFEVLEEMVGEPHNLMPDTVTYTTLIKVVCGRISVVEVMVVVGCLSDFELVCKMEKEREL